MVLVLFYFEGGFYQTVSNVGFSSSEKEVHDKGSDEHNKESAPIPIHKKKKKKKTKKKRKQKRYILLYPSKSSPRGLSNKLRIRKGTT